MLHRSLRIVAGLFLLASGCSGNDESTSTGAGGAASSSGPAAGGSAQASSSSAGGGAGGAATSTTGAGGSGGGPASCQLTDSGPVAATADGQVLERLRIVSANGPAITVDGFSDVIVRDCLIEHQGGPGITFSSAPNLRIERTHVVHTGAPATGENPSSDLNNIEGYGSTGVVIDHVKLERGSSGVYLVQSPGARLTFVQGHDFRGPFPRGQLAQFDKSDGCVLEDFSVINPPGSWPEDNVNIYQSIDVEVRRGLVDGNNSPSGVGVIFDGGMAFGIVEDVDAIRMGNGCFSDYDGSDGVIFRRTRCRENICTDQGRGVPLSNALMFCGHVGYTQIRLEQAAYFAACNPGNIVWPANSFAVADVVEQDFALRLPIELSFCWE